MLCNASLLAKRGLGLTGSGDGGGGGGTAQEENGDFRNEAYLEGRVLRQEESSDLEGEF